MKMTDLSYWDKRYLRIKAQELQNTADYESSLKSRLSSLEYELEQEMNAWYSKYADNHDIDPDMAKRLLKTVGSTNWTMTLEEFKRKAIKGGYTKELNSEYFKSRIARLQDLEEQLKEISSSFASDETDSLSNRLTDQFQETYMTTIFNTQVQQNKITGNFARFNEDQIKYIVNQPWHKEDFSKRVWKNYHDGLPNQLVDVMLRGTFMGYSPQHITKMFQQRFEGIRRRQIHRLVITEMGHIAEQATAKAYEESGIEEYQYMATLESHTCDVCGHLDGKIFKMSEKKEGINYPLIHPHCRCTTVPHIEGLPDVRERWMRDPETGKGKTIKNMSFDEWKNMVSQEHEEKLSAGTYGANLKYVRSKAFEDKIHSNEKLSRISPEIAKVSRRMLQHRNGTSYEDYYLLDMKSGKTVALSNKATKKKGVVYNNQVKESFNSGSENQYISLHNHPSGYPPSLSDIATLSLKSKNNSVGMGLTVGHDGSIYWYTKANKKLTSNANLLYGKQIKKYVKLGYNEIRSQELALLDYSNKYDFKFGKVGE